MSAATIDLLRESLGSKAVDAAYAAKQLHTVPDAPVVNRREFVLARVTGKRVLEFGASGPLHEAIVKAAAECVGVDREAAEGVIAFDLDDIFEKWLPLVRPEPDIVVCGEVLEHLSNPGWFLMRLKRQFSGVPVIITVPNAHSASGTAQLAKGIENVNRDHVAWYSWHTLKVLVERVGYRITDFAWYNGKPLFAEGLIMVVE